MRQKNIICYFLTVTMSKGDLYIKEPCREIEVQFITLSFHQFFQIREYI